MALTMDLPEEESEPAAWGTAAHTVAEKVLHGDRPSDKHVGSVIKTKSHEIEVTEEMIDVVDNYVGYVVELIDSEPDAVLHVEQNFRLDSLKPPFDAGGTADAVVYFPSQKRLEVVDLKTGRGVVVAATGNPQLRTYALGAMLANKGLDVEKITVTIVQPRASHPDGRTRSETFHIADLVEWTADLLAAMKLSKEAAQDFDMGGMSQAQWSAAYLRPGDHCADTFCKARATCPALRQKVEDQVGIWFEDNQPRLANVPDSESPDERALRLDSLDLIEDWVKAVRAREHALAEGGNPATNYVLVPKQGREKWKDDADAKVLAAAKTAGLSPNQYLNPGKLRTPKQIRKELGPKADLVAGLSTTPDAGTNLVRADKTNREAVPSKVDRFFEAPID
ncbi:Phage protein [Devosia sp. H5989]|nr:Phage protein [Devosia sp. H5989]